MKKKKKYIVETELANYVLSEFLDPLAGANKYNGSPIPYNFNEVLNHIYSKTGIFEHPFSFTKNKLQNHLLQVEDHYFRSKRDGIHKVGYGGHDKDVLAILNKYLGITKEAYKKYSDVGLHVILLKFDHDGHNDEKDSSKVQDWLISEHFEDTHKEPSTSLSGEHGYLKVAYPSDLSIEYVCSVIKQVFALLDKKRELLGFSSPIDVPCGLPNLINWDDSISVETPMPIISYKEYLRYRNMRKSIIAGETTELDALSTIISAQYKYSDIKNILSIPLPCSILQSQCGKVPRFITRDNPYSPSIDNIISFYNLRYYHFSSFVSLLSDLSEELGESGLSEEPSLVREPSLSQEPSLIGQGDLARCHSPNTPCLVSQAGPSVGERRGEEEVVSNLVSPPQGEMKISKEDYMKVIEDKTKKIENNAARVNSLYYRYSQYLGYVATEEEVEKEYIRLKLNKTETGEGRKKRLKNGRRWVEAVLRSEKKGFRVRDWEKNKESMVERIESSVDKEDRQWFKGKKRYNLTTEDLALIYYAILKSNEIDDNKKTNTNKKYAFSYKQVRDTFRAICNKGCHNDKIATIFKVMRKSKRIDLVGDFEIGGHGNKYKAQKK